MLKARWFSEEDTYSMEEREQILADTADGIKDEFRFTRQLTKDELDQRRERKVNLDIELAKRTDELKQYTADAKKAMEPLALESGTLLSVVRNRFEESTERVFFIKDHESGMIGFYDVRGDLVFSRRMTPEERQKDIYSDIRVDSDTPAI